MSQLNAAFLVGVEDFDSHGNKDFVKMNPLPYATSQINSIAGLFRSDSSYEKEFVVCLTKDRTTRYNIINEFRKLLRRMRKKYGKPHDKALLLIYILSHGRGIGDELYFYTRDTIEHKIPDKKYRDLQFNIFKNTSISISQLRSLVKDMTAGNNFLELVFVVDVCRNFE